MPAAGKSLWPLLRDGDSLRVERCLSVRLGDLAVIRLGDALLAHIVVSIHPLRTAATNGRVDPPAHELLGRVIAFRRGRQLFSWPERAAWALRWWPALARAARRLPGAHTVVHRLRDR